ncbi:hypothetical protein THAOC_04307, partial [Thalassiosira oceanica]
AFVAFQLPNKRRESFSLRDNLLLRRETEDFVDRLSVVASCPQFCGCSAPTLASRVGKKGKRSSIKFGKFARILLYIAVELKVQSGKYPDLGADENINFAAYQVTMLLGQVCGGFLRAGFGDDSMFLKTLSAVDGECVRHLCDNGAPSKDIEGDKVHTCSNISCLKWGSASQNSGDTRAFANVYDALRRNDDESAISFIRMGRQQIATNFLACRDLCIDTLSEVIWPAERIKESCSVTKLAKFTGYFSATTGEKCDLVAERDVEVCDPGALSLLLAAKAGEANAVRDSSASVSMKDTLKRRRVSDLADQLGRSPMESIEDFDDNDGGGKCSVEEAQMDDLRAEVEAEVEAKVRAEVEAEVEAKVRAEVEADVEEIRREHWRERLSFDKEIAKLNNLCALQSDRHLADEAKIKERQGQLKELEDRLAERDASMLELERRVKSAGQMAASLERDKRAMAERVEGAKAERAGLESTIGELKSRIGGLEEDLAAGELERTNVRLGEENSELAKKIGGLEEDLAAGELERSRLEAQVAEARRDAEAGDRTNVRLGEENSELAKKLEAATKAASRAQDIADGLRGDHAASQADACAHRQEADESERAHADGVREMSAMIESQNEFAQLYNEVQIMAHSFVWNTVEVGHMTLKERIQGELVLRSSHKVQIKNPLLLEMSDTDNRLSIVGKVSAHASESVASITFDEKSKQHEDIQTHISGGYTLVAVPRESRTCNKKSNRHTATFMLVYVFGTE